MIHFINLRFILIAALGLCGLSACGLSSSVKSTISVGACPSGSIESGCAAESSKVLSLTRRRPLAIKSGDTVTLTGTGFNKAMSATIGGIPVTSLDVTSATSASLVVPAGVATGMSDLKLALNTAEATASMAYTPANDIPLMTVAASEVCAGVAFYDINGDSQTGTKSCSGSSSTQDCTPPAAWDLRAGTTVSGVTGKLKVNCRNAATLASFDIDVGQSATVAVASPGVFTITAHGLTDGTTVRLNYSTAPTGLNNSTTYYVVNASTNSFQLSAISGGTGINVTSLAGANVTVHRWQATPAVVDIWDTIDDYNGLPASTGFPPTWSVANNYCGGVEATAGDDNVWKDVTTTDGTTASTCTETSANCTMKDKISGLKWSKSYQVSGSQTTMPWWAAVTYCNASGYNGQTAGSWRLPTQKELMNAYEHGITSAASTDWMTLANMRTYFWSASSHSLSTFNAWIVNLANGSPNYNPKGTTNVVVCVQ